MPVGADELRDVEDEGPVPRRVAQQLPRQARGVGGVGVHLEPQPGKTVRAGLRPHPGGVAGAERGGEQYSAEGGELGLNGSRHGRGGVMGELGVILQVPAGPLDDHGVDGQLERGGDLDRGSPRGGPRHDHLMPAGLAQHWPVNEAHRGPRKATLVARHARPPLCCAGPGLLRRFETGTRGVSDVSPAEVPLE